MKVGQMTEVSKHGFSADTVWVMIALGLVAALAILWVVDWLGRRS
jgi:hypothetical protein